MCEKYKELAKVVEYLVVYWGSDGNVDLDIIDELIVKLSTQLKENNES